MRNMTKSRLIVMIKKDIAYTRIKNYEEEDLSLMWIRIKINKSKYLFIHTMCLQTMACARGSWCSKFWKSTDHA